MTYEMHLHAIRWAEGANPAIDRRRFMPMASLLSARLQRCGVLETSRNAHDLVSSAHAYVRVRMSATQ
jgi:hypothetical protein